MANEIFTKPLSQILDEMKARIEELEKICRSHENDLRAMEKDREE
jgi:hypothetical protein